jgi:hypothetical protein
MTDTKPIISIRNVTKRFGNGAAGAVGLWQDHAAAHAGRF